MRSGSEGTHALLVMLVVTVSVGCSRSQETPVRQLRFWGMGREGEVVAELVRDFERENPDIRVDVQQIPWSAAHEKLLTGFVGLSTPDVAQLGNTWISEFVTLGALEPLDPWLTESSIGSASYFAGIWDTNVIDGALFGLPWYVDTRVLFYRKDLLARAGYAAVPSTWGEWEEAMSAIKRERGEKGFAILLPVNEWTQPIILGMQTGSTLLADDATRGAFTSAEFQRAFDFYLDLFEKELAPPISTNDVANLYQEFARGYFAMYITGPWNLGEFERRLPDSLQSEWATASLPGPTGPGASIAGGSSLVLMQRSKHKDAAWQLIEYLSQPEQQLRFWRLTGDLPARVEAWQDSSITGNRRMVAFREQLERALPAPRVPEWEQIANRLQDVAEAAIRGSVAPDSALVNLDREVDRMLEKRRWMLARERGAGAQTSAREVTP